MHKIYKVTSQPSNIFFQSGGVALTVTAAVLENDFWAGFANAGHTAENKTITDNWRRKGNANLPNFWSLVGILLKNFSIGDLLFCEVSDISLMKLASAVIVIWFLDWYVENDSLLFATDLIWYPRCNGVAKADAKWLPSQTKAITHVAISATWTISKRKSLQSSRWLAVYPVKWQSKMMRHGLS